MKTRLEIEMEFMSIEDTAKRLSMPYWCVVGAMRSGLLGEHRNNQVSVSAIASYELYGTQWGMEKRTFDYSLMSTNEPIGWSDTPPGTFAEMEISPTGFEDTTQDKAWIAQFYLKPNPYFFIDPNSQSYNSVKHLLLDKKFSLTNGNYPNRVVNVYPDPDGSLALISVSVIKAPEGSPQTPLEFANEIIQPLLSELSFKYDKPIFITQRHSIGLPSGVISIPTESQSSGKMIALEDLNDLPELREPKSLYHTALTQNEPMYKFLSFYRVIELLATKVKAILMASNQKKLRIPNHPAFGDYADKSCGQVTVEMKSKYRNAIAHADRATNSTIISTAAPIEYKEMILNIQVVRYIARQYLKIVEDSLLK